MTDSYNDFHARVARIYELNEETSKKASKMSLKAKHDGTFVIRGALSGFRVPWTGIMMILMAVFVLKGSMIARVGPDVYKTQVGRLVPSTLLEQVGAWTMRPDPISNWVALQIKHLS